MILSGKEIQRQIDLGTIEISPFSRSRLNPNSYNLSLANELMIYNSYRLNMKEENRAHIVKIPETGLELIPDKLYLGRTEEYTRTECFVPMLEGRSSVGRLGVYIHVTAGFGDVGFHGYWTLEIHCVQPVVIYPHVEIAQIYFHTIDGEYEKYVNGKYQDNKGIQPSMLYKDFQ